MELMKNNSDAIFYVQVVKPEHSCIVKAFFFVGSVGAIHTCVSVVNVQH